MEGGWGDVVKTYERKKRILIPLRSQTVGLYARGCGIGQLQGTSNPVV